tara:strand:+ start:2828 stop:3019 length:192 start_codon:yes stop_codon:yes gene_type:complete
MTYNGSAMASRAEKKPFCFRLRPQPKLLHFVLIFLFQEPNQKIWRTLQTRPSQWIQYLATYLL